MQWNIDPAHTNATFKIRHLGISNVRGSIKDVTGTIETDDAGQPTSVRASLPVSTIDTGSADRDNHLKSADFFDAAQFPNIEFVSTGITKKGDGEYAIAGNLTMHGVTRPVTLDAEISPPATDPFSGTQKIGGEAEVKLNRKDFGLEWNVALEAGGVLVGDTVTIRLEVQAAQA
ncbi:protein YceI [Deinococcus xinjiangensis]|uniref:Protein YceI n=1 Tax=Deinococcus xinjiangensis TaxID=457454 RepID=A0ABP9VAY9_9DEIO